uniref:Uncharacterized protein n=1 Tax=Oryza barthii TaxID=65489 RepID=A0A0D3FT38_9ORYZ
MSDVLMSSMSLMSPGNGGDPRPKRSRPARVARRTGLSKRYGSQTRRCGRRVAAAATTEVGALMARALLVMSCVVCLDDEDMGAGGEVGYEQVVAVKRRRGQAPHGAREYEWCGRKSGRGSMPIADAKYQGRSSWRPCPEPAAQPWRLLSPSPCTCDPVPRLPGEQRSAMGQGATAG